MPDEPAAAPGAEGQAPAAEPGSEAQSTPVEGQPPQADATAAKPPEGQQAAPEGEQKPSGETTSDEPEPKADDQAPKVKAPEQYEFTPPEGHEFNPATLGAFEAVARELDLTQEQAAKVVDAVVPAMIAQHQEQAQQWRAQAEADPEIGGDKLAESVKTASSFMQKFGGDGLTEFLNQSGFGNHPAVIRLFTKAGQAFSEDGFVPGRSAAAPVSPQERAKRHFPNSQHN